MQQQVVIRPPSPEPEPRAELAGRYGRVRDPTAGLWTEVTKDLVVKEAIIQMGYEFEETEDYYYIIAYLRYVSLLHSHDIVQPSNDYYRKTCHD